MIPFIRYSVVCIWWHTHDQLFHVGKHNNKFIKHVNLDIIRLENVKSKGVLMYFWLLSRFFITRYHCYFLGCTQTPYHENTNKKFEYDKHQLYPNFTDGHRITVTLLVRLTNRSLTSVLPLILNNIKNTLWRVSVYTR